MVQRSAALGSGGPGPLERLMGARFDGVPRRPEVDSRGQGAVPGVFLVGDLLDAPLIKTAMLRGEALGRALAAELAAERSVGGAPDLLDVLIVGAGPAGASVALALQGQGLAVALVDQEEPFASIAAFPAGKVLYAEPVGGPSPLLPFEDGSKDALVLRWRAALAAAGVGVASGQRLTGLRRQNGLLEVDLETSAGAVRRVARRVVLALGKRGQPRTLALAGAHARTRLDDPAAHRGQACLVVGGGDSAVEAAVALAEAGASVQLIVRGAGLDRARPRNQARAAEAVRGGALQVHTHAEVVGLTGAEALVRVGDETRRLPAAEVFALMGADPPVALLRRIGLRMEGDASVARAAWVLGFLALVWCFYVLKGGLQLFPFGPADPLAGAAEALKVDLGFREVGAGFWGTAIYSALIVGFGLRAHRRATNDEQRARFRSLMGFQLVFLFGIPELLAPLLIERPWKLYALSVPWPLSLWSLVDAPGWANGSLGAALGWLGVGALSSFVLIPWYVRRNGQAFCSHLCGCGGLAETLGDLWRDRAPRGAPSRTAEWAGRVVLLLAIPTTLLILADAWGLISGGALSSAKAFAQRWYGLMVDFGLASLLGVAAYPVLGNRAWCRFFCPLRAYMEVLAKRFARPQIVADSRCIGCGDCTRACQMGIEVQRFAQTETPLHNGNSACIQCGVCVAVCPMDVLRLEPSRPVEAHTGGLRAALSPPRPPWERGGAA